MNNKTLHITWKNGDLSEKQKFILNRWSSLNPNLKIQYYDKSSRKPSTLVMGGCQTDDLSEEFIKSNPPEYESVINKSEYSVPK